MSRTQLWVEKYRPTSIDDLASQEEVTKTLRGAIQQGQLPHLLMYGPPGTGKTSTILAVARTLYHPSVLKDRVLEMNASDERGIKIVRDKIKNFASHSVSSQKFDGYPSPPFKIIILDECDSMTKDAQGALRRTMEVRSRRPAVLRRLHAIDATRFHQTRSWVVSFSSLSPFGPRRATAMLRAGLLVDDALLPDLQLRQSHHRAVGVALCEVKVLSIRKGRDAKKIVGHCVGAGREL